MREILFRGKCRDTVKWYEGQYIHLTKTTYCFKEDYECNTDNDIHQIVFEEMTDWGLPNRHLRVDVLPETVGQYTDLKDKNGKMIFEGDIVRTKKYGRIIGHSCVADYDVFKVVYLPAVFRVENANRGFNFVGRGIDYEVIGNIHDTPELLKENKNNDR